MESIPDTFGALQNIMRNYLRESMMISASTDHFIYENLIKLASLLIPRSLLHLDLNPSRILSRALSNGLSVFCWVYIEVVFRYTNPTKLGSEGRCSRLSVYAFM